MSVPQVPKSHSSAEISVINDNSSNIGKNLIHIIEENLTKIKREVIILKRCY